MHKKKMKIVFKYTANEILWIEDQNVGDIFHPSSGSPISRIDTTSLRNLLDLAEHCGYQAHAISTETHAKRIAGGIRSYCASVARGMALSRD